VTTSIWRAGSGSMVGRDWKLGAWAGSKGREADALGR
jgi:hypothetical protein